MKHDSLDTAMKRITFSIWALMLAACAGQPAHPPVDQPVAPSDTVAEPMEQTETEKLNAWFEEKYFETVNRSPMFQTYLGIKTDYDKWDDASDANALREMEIQRDVNAEMHARFDYDRLDDQAKLSWRLADFQLAQAEASFPFRHYSYTFNQMFGVQSGIPSFLINQHRITSVSDAEAYISRLNGLPEYLGQNVENARTSAALGVRPPLFVFDYVIADSENIISGAPFEGEGVSPLMDDFVGKIDALAGSGEFSDEEASRLKTEAEQALIRSVGPAFQATIDFLKAEQALATTDDGAWKLPNGADYYAMRLAQMTTTDMTADEVHELGLSEVARIHNEMRAIMQAVGFEGSLQDFFAFTRTDPQFFKPETEEGKAEYLAEATALIDIMREALPSQFNTFPKAELIVKAVEPFRERSAGKAFYQRPSPDGSRPGTYYANLYKMSSMPIYQMEALAYHEGIPGHHMQIAIAQELEGIPSFRKFGGYTAYTEGWGLYSEYFPKEMGFYSDPYSDFGRLAMELWRAARLVVDTGLHDKRWTREEAIQYLIDNTPNPEGDCIKAIERYIVMPGQATAYKIGMNKILDLRERARAELGDGFDIRSYHDVVLKNGAVPLSILEETVEAWVASQTMD